MIRVDFTLPAEFQEIPLEAVATAGEGEGQTNETARILRRISRFLSDVGVVYAANCLHTVEGRPSLGSLAVAVVDHPYGHSAATAARGTVQAVLESRGRAGAAGSSMLRAVRPPSSPVAGPKSSPLRSLRTAVPGARRYPPRSSTP